MEYQLQGDGAVRPCLRRPSCGVLLLQVGFAVLMIFPSVSLLWWSDVRDCGSLVSIVGRDSSCTSSWNPAERNSGLSGAKPLTAGLILNAVFLLKQAALCLSQLCSRTPSRHIVWSATLFPVALLVPLSLMAGGHIAISSAMKPVDHPDGLYLILYFVIIPTLHYFVACLGWAVFFCNDPNKPGTGHARATDVAMSEVRPDSQTQRLVDSPYTPPAVNRVPHRVQCAE
eukprot:TRINITY_DN50791_c0_g1_i1.p2 TRINITY_DN50791_c0_g1~~TRINITY_DN50791_c0_g1_i1.p2  ORF type:complete len:228 (+),score=48.37 TRINITY_DN50791_c0_g1_i1:147-830(+)